jgi:signal transduction histidine kinase
MQTDIRLAQQLPGLPALETEAERTARLERRIAKLEKINAALVDRVERSTDFQPSGFSLFQTAIGLERQVRERTEELTRTLRKLERAKAEAERAREEAERAREEAERANYAKTRFLAFASHDLLQPVNAARLSASALTEVPMSSEATHLTRQVDRALTTIEDLLKTLLDISQLDAGVIVPTKKAVPLGEILADLASDFEPLVRRKGLKLTIMPSRLWVESDPILLRRVLQNLISNAVRYTERGGVLVGARRRGADVRIEVVDTGPGIPLDQHAAIFQEFNRGGAAERPGETALGLGLSIVSRLVDALGHGLDLQSREGHGSSFAVTVPMLPARETVVATDGWASPVHGYGLSGATIAVIENDATVRDATAALIERWFCDVVAARGTADALATLTHAPRRPDVILADYHLDHGETGIDAIQAIRDHHRADIPAVIITADYGAEVAARAAFVGADVLQKPVKPAALRALLAHLVG